MHSSTSVTQPFAAFTKGRRRLWSALSLASYVVLLALPVWYNAVRVPREALPYAEIISLAAAVAQPLSAALPATITAYVVCPGRSYTCLEYHQLSEYGRQLGLSVLKEAGLNPEQVPLVVRVVHDAPGSCSASSWSSPGEAARRAVGQPTGGSSHGGGPGGRGGGGGGGAGPSGGGGSDCLDLVSSPDLHPIVLAGQERDFDDWAAEQLAGQDRPGSYHVFVVPDPWLAASKLPYGSVGRHRTALVRYPATRHGPTHGSVVRLVALLSAPAFASQLGPVQRAAGTQLEDSPGPGCNPDSDAGGQPLPLSAAAQLHMSFSLCNAHPSPYEGDGAGTGGGPSSRGATSAGGDGGDGGDGSAAAALTWDFPRFEAQFVAPLKQVLSPAARLTVSSQVLYFTPARVNGTWDARHGAFVLPYSQLPFFVDSSWPLDPGRTGLPASAAGGGQVPYDVAVVTVGSRHMAVGEVLAAALPQAGTVGRAASEAAAAAALPHLLPPPLADKLPPAVLHFVLYAPQPRQRPLVFLGPDGEPTPANSFRVPGWGMLQVLNQVPEPGLIVARVGQEAMEAFAVELVSQLRVLLGLGPARRRLLRLVQASANTPTPTPTTISGASGTSASGGGAAVTPAVGRVSLLSALRTGLAPWEVDALVRRRVREDAAAAAATLTALARLLRTVPTLAVPGRVGALVRDAAAALRRTMQYAAQGRYEEASRSAQEARSWAEAAFGDPAMSSRLNVPDTHMVGVYLPFCLPAAVPLLQALFQELRRRRKRRPTGGPAAGKELKERQLETEQPGRGSGLGAGSEPGVAPEAGTDAAAAGEGAADGEGAALGEGGGGGRSREARGDAEEEALGAWVNGGK